MINPFIHALLSNTNEVKDISIIGETMAYTWFGRPNAAFSATAQKYWIGTTRDTDLGTTQHVTEYDINEDTYTTTQVGTAYQKDDHNQAQILIRQSDGRLIACYCEHGGAAFRWRISTNPHDSTAWGDENTLTDFTSYSYATPYQSSDGTIFIFYRVLIVDGETTTATWYYHKSTDAGETFGTPVEFYNNGATQAYVITCQDGNIVHFACTNGHPQHTAEGNISVFHFYMDLSDETFHKSDGTAITAPVLSSDPSPVHLTTSPDTAWILDITVKDGKPRIIYPLYPSGLTTSWLVKELWYIEWDGSAWVNNKKIDQTMSGYIETTDDVSEFCYTGASRFDTSNPDIIWMPKQVNGILEIHKVDLRITPVYIEQLTFDSPVNNWRPISIPSKANNLLWLRNNYYYRYYAYSISLMTKTELVV